jgi:hypothetical protein
MTSMQSFSLGLAFTLLFAGGCAVDTSGSEDDALAAAYAAVEAGVCTPDCSDRACGLDPICGVSCGECRTGESCDEAAGQCEAACVPDCSGRTCGLDPVCGVSCGTCGKGTSCNEDAGKCEAKPSGPGNGHVCRWSRWFKRRGKHR